MFISVCKQVQPDHCKFKRILALRFLKEIKISHYSTIICVIKLACKYVWFKSLISQVTKFNIFLVGTQSTQLSCTLVYPRSFNGQIVSMFKAARQRSYIRSRLVIVILMRPKRQTGLKELQNGYQIEGERRRGTRGNAGEKMGTGIFQEGLSWSTVPTRLES